ncbi:MAG: fibronectin/fibrinogen-binding protein [Ruminococcaceae bacterium]|nr:fibronectin/fibrinogen-binding protein [Oscillospiraceae bacterium]
MALDALFLSRLVYELNETLSGAKIDKIQQPERDEFVFHLRTPAGARMLLLSAGNSPRIHLTEQKLENPKTPPMFCMLLRKHLQGGTILRVTQPSLERVVDITVAVNNEFGDRVTRTLTLELIGRYTNLILRDGEDRIIDCMKRLDLTQGGDRGVLPGLFYRLPAPPEKRAIGELSRAELVDLMDADLPADRFLVQTFLGVSPLVAREIVYRACGDSGKLLLCMTREEKERVASVLEEVFALENPVPILYLENGIPKEFSFLKLSQYQNHYVEEVCENFSKLLDRFYGEKSAKERMMRKSAVLRKNVETALNRIRRKIGIQEEEIRQAQERDTIREEAELITANLYQIPHGASRVTVIDYFKEDAPEREIKLDRTKTPQEYAAKLFHKYQRMKHASAALAVQIEQGEEEVRYLESVLESLMEAETERDLLEIREELGETGYVRIPKNEKKMKQRTLEPWVYHASDGTPIYVGRNNRQNDLLTMKTAQKGDIWFHTQRIPGAHVILACGGEAPSNETLTEAAIIAAYHSNARASAQVPVDYTAVKNVKKPPGAKPGMVNYFKYETAFVTPNETMVRTLRDQ